MKEPRGASAIGTLIGFILILIILGAVWAVTGGPSRPISHAGPFLGAPSVPGVDLGVGSSTEAIYGGGISYSSERGDSPYAEDVRMSARGIGESNPNREHIQLEVSPGSSGSVTITGWSLESKTTGMRATLGTAAPLPASGAISAQFPVSVSAASTIYVVTGRAPTGISFRENVCTGYFEQFQDFAPELARECPAPYEEHARLGNPGTADCMNYVLTLNRCETAVASVPSDAGAECQNFVQNDLTYSGCVAAHRNDPSFYRNEWRMFLNQGHELWGNQHDEIRLIDENGKVVSSVSY